MALFRVNNQDEILLEQEDVTIVTPYPVIFLENKRISTFAISLVFPKFWPRLVG